MLKLGDSRRSDDESGENHTKERHVYVVRESTHTKWVVGVVSAGIISALVFFAGLDRNNLDSKASAALQLSTTNAAAIRVLDVKLDGIQETLNEIKDEVKDSRKSRSR